MVGDYVSMHSLGPAPMCRALDLPLTSDSSHTRRVEYSDIHHTRWETQCTAVRTNNALPVHWEAHDGEKMCAGAGLVVGANASPCGPSLTDDTYREFMYS